MFKHHSLRQPVLSALFAGAVLASGAALLSSPAQAASHREAPFIAGLPKLDSTDLYMFRSYEPGRENFVTIIANYVPFQTPYGGPNFFQLDPNALYEIHIDNNGDAVEDMTFQFRFKNNTRDLAVLVGGKTIPVPLFNIGALTGVDDSKALNVEETYSLTVARNGRRGGAKGEVTDAGNGSKVFTKPADNIGQKSIPDYNAYANQFIRSINIPGCATPGKVFVGQRKEPFFVNLGEAFDLINLANPIGARNANPNVLDDDNVTSLALELPISCITKQGEPVVGAWTTASLRQARLLNAEGKREGKHFASLEGGPWVQMSRLGNPLVNELVIGVKDKDRFSSAKPKDDAQFIDYVTNPTLPVLIHILFDGAATLPPATPRNDLVAVFLTGVTGLNQPANVKGAEMLRLNTSTPVTARAAQKDLGVIGGDLAGFPNGRRPIDDVTDIALRAAMGVLNDPAGPDHPAAANLLTDGTQLPGAAAGQGAVDFGTSFPYLNMPITSSLRHN